MDKEKKGQEEIVGFAVIVIIVAIILVIVLGFLLRKTPNTSFQTSYQAESFVQSMLQYTTDCFIGGYLSTEELVISCDNKELCDDGRDSCDALNETAEGIIGKSWSVGAEYPTKGYELKIEKESGLIIDIKQGNETTNSRGAESIFSRGKTNYDLLFKVYI